MGRSLSRCPPRTYSFGILTGGDRNKLLAQPDVGRIGLVLRVPRGA
jgi:hypothetical protein